MNQRLLIATVAFSLVSGASAFSYKDAKNWGKKYPKCDGKNQSPMLLDLMNSYAPGAFETIDMKIAQFDELPKTVTITNTGHTVEMRADWSGEPPSVAGGPLHGKYVFEKTTFHWGRKAWTETENYTPYLKHDFFHDVDMHMYFYKADLNSFEKAQSQRDGLVVFKIGLKTGIDNHEHMFENLEKSLNKVQSINSTAVIAPFRLANVVDFKRETNPFDYYKGSLDHPPCFESVTWFISEYDISTTKTLVKEFRKIKLADGDVTNVRPPQAKNGRSFNVAYAVE